jgi:uracil phosphoribosyltransferase
VPVHLIDHPIAGDTLSGLRAASTSTETFRRLARRLSHVLAVEATRDLSVRETVLDTPLERASGLVVSADVVLVPVLRAGLGLVEPWIDLLPGARVGHIGLQRDERTAEASQYYAKLPPLQTGATVILLDPMLATGGSAVAALTLVHAAGAHRVRLVSVVAAPEGLAAVERAFPGTDVYTTAIDRGLNDHKFILPGLGDFGDRLYGT